MELDRKRFKSLTFISLLFLPSYYQQHPSLDISYILPLCVCVPKFLVLFLHSFDVLMESFFLLFAHCPQILEKKKLLILGCQIFSINIGEALTQSGWIILICPYFLVLFYFTLSAQLLTLPLYSLLHSSISLAHFRLEI